MDFTSQLSSAPTCFLHPLPVLACTKTNRRGNEAFSAHFHTHRSAEQPHSPDANGEVTTNSFARKCPFPDNIPSQITSLPSPDTASLPIYQGNSAGPPVLFLLSWCQHHAGICRCDKATQSPPLPPCPARISQLPFRQQLQCKAARNPWSLRC